jgi:hypothetical protein
VGPVVLGVEEVEVILGRLLASLLLRATPLMLVPRQLPIQTEVIHTFWTVLRCLLRVVRAVVMVGMVAKQLMV